MSAAEREYRVGELARAAGIKVRNLRYYQERGLLPPPRREGRVAWYRGEHLARLRVISELLGRGHTLNGIGELLAAWEQDSNVADVLGLERVMTEAWSHEEPVTLDRAAVRRVYGDQLTEENLRRAVALGYATVDGDSVTVVSRRLLDGSAALVREGVPLSAVLEAAARLQEQVDAMAGLFVALVGTHVVGDLGERPLPAAEIHRISEVVARLRPVAGDVAGAAFARAMEGRVRAEFGDVLDALGTRRRAGCRAGARV
ncbi:MerR family transcriptional regulator [Streptomyces capparidis]